MPLLHEPLPEGAGYSRAHQALQRTPLYGRGLYRADDAEFDSERKVAERVRRVQKLRKGLPAADQDFGNDVRFL